MTPVLIGLVVLAAGWVAVRPRRFCWRIADLRPVVSLRPDGPRRRSRGDRGASAAVAACADLLSVALAAGCSVHEAVLAVGGTEGAPGALREAASRLRRGATLHAALDALAGAGTRWHALSTVLALSATAGTPAAGSLRRLATQERTRERRMRERRARRLPVILLVPLTTMVLPAFLLLTVVPFTLVSTASLELPPSTDPTTSEEP